MNELRNYLDRLIFGLPVLYRFRLVPQSICGYSERFIELNWLHFVLLFRFGTTLVEVLLITCVMYSLRLVLLGFLQSMLLLMRRVLSEVIRQMKYFIYFYEL